MPKILIVDDERMMVDMYATKFTMEGFEVVTAFDGVDGLQKALKEKPDIISMDVIMPRMDGFAVVKILKDDPQTRDIPLYFLTNLGQDEDIWRGYALGADEYFVMARYTPVEIVKKAKALLSLTKRKPHILIFEDENMLAEIYVTKFHLMGFNAKAYNNPSKDPVSIVLKEKPDLILSGVTMPVINGFVAAELIKGDPRTKSIPLIFLTNLSQDEDVKRGRDIGAVDYLVKAHFTPSSVVDRVCKVLKTPVLKDRAKKIPILHTTHPLVPIHIECPKRVAVPKTKKVFLNLGITPFFVSLSIWLILFGFVGLYKESFSAPFYAASFLALLFAVLIALVQKSRLR